MRIGIVSPGWPARAVGNGVASYVEALRPALQRLGHEVVVLAPHDWVEPGAPGPVHVVAASRAFRIARWVRRRLGRARPGMVDAAAVLAAAAVTAVRNHRLDVLEVEEAFGVCGEVGAAVRIPVVVKLHGPAFLLEHESQAGAERELRIAREGVGLARAAAVVAPSQATLDATLARYRLHPAVTRRVPNPLALPEGPLWSAATADPDRVLYVGRFEHVKGGDLALAAFARIAAQRPNARLWFVGHDRGMVGPGGRRVSLADHLRTALPPEVAARVDVLGVVPREELVQLRQRAGVALVASRFETQSYAALEAMAHGCPVVAFAVGGVAEIVRDGRTGLAVPAEDVGALAAAALRVLADPALAARLGTGAREFVRTTHDPDAIAATMVEVYEAALARAR